MKHMYSDQLVAYLFNEIDPDTKSNLERELATNSALLAELNDLKASIGILSNCKPLSPSQDVIDRIISASEDAEPILSH